jgi:hypothetical protein
MPATTPSASGALAVLSRQQPVSVVPLPKPVVCLLAFRREFYIHCNNQGAVQHIVKLRALSGSICRNPSFIPHLDAGR